MPDTAMPTADSAATAATARRWTREDILALFELPFMELLHRAHETHRQHHDPNKVQLSTLMNIKTGGCQEDCKYCAQSVKYDTGLAAEKLLDRAQVRAAAEKAKKAGAGRFCMGAAWRELKDRDVEKLANIVRDVKDLGLEACMTLGMLTRPQADALKDAGLDYYNHNLDTSEEFYEQIVSTHSYRDRLDTLANVRDAGLKVCSGGIVGLGESRVDRAGLLETLANLSPQPESVPINKLVSVAGTPLGGVDVLDAFEFIRTIAVARILMPRSYVRLSAGRRSLSDEGQALCFYAGANSIFYGDKLLTTGNPEHEADQRLFDRLGLEADGGAH
ncbi:biotin synthase BioB [Azospirillum isscasi]|uniref:Biotin synthase n=1 Tax=Azospirillum isscasi TaxID=3053926 RepID=A0ABU0WMM4_9PROT|nr:biotin synthase BioB [Azospirillum isscasi]MDQ2105431.1 biotin synthase BioB [Azospirillum isscasi]